MTLLTNDIQDRLAKLLVEEGLVQESKIELAIKEAGLNNQSLMSYMIEHKLLDNEILVHATSHVSGIPYVNLENTTIPQETLDLISVDIAERNMAVPIAEVQGRIAVAMLDATNIQAVDYLSSLIQRPLKVFMASQNSIKHVLDQYKTDLSGVDALAENVDAQKQAEAESKRQVQTIVQDSPISKALNTILEYAVRAKASDIHIEPLEKSLKIRCRIDGVLREIMNLPKAIEPALISRIETPKLLSTSTMRALFALISSMSTFGLSPSSYFLRRSSVGFLYLVKGSSGSIGVLRISSTLTTNTIRQKQYLKFQDKYYLMMIVELPQDYLMLL